VAAGAGCAAEPADCGAERALGSASACESTATICVVSTLHSRASHSISLVPSDGLSAEISPVATPRPSAFCRHTSCSGGSVVRALVASDRICSGDSALGATPATKLTIPLDRMLPSVDACAGGAAGRGAVALSVGGGRDALAPSTASGRGEASDPLDGTVFQPLLVELST
jgi:hypothetical protein